MSATVSNARNITRRAKSNLAFALASLPDERRTDMTCFYAFCRIVDDHADNELIPVADRRAALDLWVNALRGPVAGEDPLADGIRRIAGKYSIPIERFEEIIRGVTMDLVPQRFQSAADLEQYCHLVASVVGLISIEIFGYTDPRCREYALALGQALQWTNILRDVAQDARNGRIYLPIDDLARFKLSTEDILFGITDHRFLDLMDFEFERTENYFCAAVEKLPAVDRKSMVAAETMRRIYHALLGKMKRDRFQVFQKRYRLGKCRMVWLLLATRMGWAGSRP